MGESVGWITLHRKIEQNWTWKEDKPYTRGQAWVDILLQVNHSPTKHMIKGQLVSCGRGQSTKSLDTWADRWGWDKSKVRRFFAMLQKDNMIETESLRVTTRLTVCNYDDYQYPRHTNGTGSTHTRNADETQTTPNNNGNNGDNGGQVELPPIPEKLSAIDGFSETWGAWVRHRSEIRHKLTYTQAEFQYRKLMKMADPVAALIHSIECGYQGIFEPKDKNGNAEFQPTPGTTKNLGD